MNHDAEETFGQRPRRIVGRQLSAVVFFQRRIELQFDHPVVLTAPTPPDVTVGTTRFKARSAGYRDALCGLIGRIVRDVSLAGGRETRIEFDDGSVISVCL